SVRAGEPVTVTMTVRGRGNLDSVTVPTIPAGSDFQTYSPEVETRKDVSGGRIGGEKVFKQVLVPLNPEVGEIPAVTFSYFDPSSRLIPPSESNTNQPSRP
ncbi:MAG: BatD family protein, partial [Pirellulaceae bacterium]